MKLKHASSSFIALSLLAGVAHAHFDVGPYIVNSKLVTGGHDDANNTNLPVVRVFGFDFAEDPSDPYFIQDPGFNAAAGALSAGSTLSFNVVGSLRYWNGAGSPSFGNAPSGESILLNFGSNDRTVTSSSGAQTGFGWLVAADGSVHRHLNTKLLGSDGNTLPAANGPWGTGDGIQAADGIYAFPMQLVTTTPGIAASDTFWIVFNDGMPEETHDAAIDYVQATFVPEPTSLATIVVASGALMRRRSRTVSR